MGQSMLLDNPGTLPTPYELTLMLPNAGTKLAEVILSLRSEQGRQADLIDLANETGYADLGADGRGGTSRTTSRPSRSTIPREARWGRSRGAPRSRQ